MYTRKITVDSAGRQPADGDGEDGAQRPSTLSSRRILVVDDDPLNREAIGLRLGRLGALVHAVASAQAAVDRLASERFDLVITDFEMPGRSGFWLIDWVRRHRDGVPVILLTGALPDAVDRAARAGRAAPDAVLRKPVAGRELVDRVRRVLRDGGVA